MTELYFLPYKTTKIYGTETVFSCFGRSEIPIPTGQHAILLIPAVETCRRSGSCPPASRRTGTRPGIPHHLRLWTGTRPGTPHRLRLWTGTRPGIPHRLRRAGRIQAGTLFLRAGQQVTGAGLNRQGPDPPG